MDANTKLLILALVSVGSLFWGILDPWAQVAAGIIGLGFVLSSLASL